MMSQEEAE